MGIDFASMLGFQPPNPQGPVDGPGYAALLNPAPPVPAAAPAPTPSPDVGNLMRAIGLAGAQLVQPMAYGQSPLGQLGQAFGTGTMAYDAGTAAEAARQAAYRKEGRDVETHVADIAGKTATTENTQAQTAGQVTANDVAARTAEDKVRQAKSQADKLIEEVSKAKNENRVSEIELAKVERAKKILDSISDEKMREAALADYDEKVAKLALTKAQTKKAGAEAGTEGAKANYYNALAQAWGPDGAKSKGKTGNTSAQVQAADLYKKEWIASNPQKPGEDEMTYAQRASTAVTQFMSQSKSKSLREQFLKWQEGNGSGNLQKDWNDFLIWDKAADAGSPMGTQPGNTAGGAATVAPGWKVKPVTK